MTQPPRLPPILRGGSRLHSRERSGLPGALLAVALAGAVGLMSAVGLMGCGSDDDCQRAASHLDDCGIQSGDAACKDSSDRCSAQCVLAATCEDLADPATVGPYEQCLAACP